MEKVMDRKSFVVVLVHWYLSLATIICMFTYGYGNPNALCRKREREALLTFKQGIADPSNQLLSWIGEECCMWKGIGCDNTTGHVIQLNLTKPDEPSYKLGGVISDSLLELENLQYLDLSSNSFEDNHFPSFFGYFRNLRFLNLSDVGFRSSTANPYQLGNLSNLHYLDIRGLFLNIDNLEWLSHLSLLEFLDMSEIDLSKTSASLQVPIQGAFQNMSALRHLYLRGTNFSYAIPNWLYNMTTLERLDLSNNHIQGVLPSAFGRLSQLIYLDLSNNSLEGKLPRFLGNLCNLRHLDLSYNKLSGGVYELLGNSSACSATSLEFLNLATNKLSGVVPPWFWNHSAQMSVLDLSDNNFHGSITSLSCGFEVYLGSNNFSGPLPNISSTIQYLDLSNNLFSGFSTAFCEDAVVHDLSFLDLSRNLLSGEIPDCWVFNYILLEELYLGNNNLTGNIPSSMGSIPSLLSLSLHKNILEGNLPLSMENQTAIELLDLSENHFSGILPLWFGKSLFTLMVLVLRSNNFSGSLPQELCRQTQLQILDVSSNNFSGSIPRCFGNFTAMVRPAYGNRIFDFIPPNGGFSQSTFLVRNGMEYEYKNILALVTSMDLSSNNLIGEIPEELTNLYGLLLLNLSHNQLHGRIPEKINAMKLLESLDVSMNQLIGVIPQGMASLTFLSHLNLSYNNFSGRIPSSTQLQSFTHLSFIGNHDLCGPPLTPSCIGDDTPLEPTTPNFDDKGGEHNGGWIDMKWFYISMPLGFVVGFWGVFAPLALNKAWRSVYFKFFDDMKYKLFSGV